MIGVRNYFRNKSHLSGGSMVQNLSVFLLQTPSPPALSCLGPRRMTLWTAELGSLLSGFHPHLSLS